MALTKTQTTISGLVNSDTEHDAIASDEDVMLTPDSAIGTTVTTKKGRGRPKTNVAKTTNAKNISEEDESTKSAEKKATMPKKGAVNKRKALKEKPNQEDHEQDEEVPQVKTRAGRKTTKTIAKETENAKEDAVDKPVKRGRKATKGTTTEPDEAPDEAPAEPQEKPTRRGRKPAQKSSTEPEQATEETDEAPEEPAKRTRTTKATKATDLKETLRDGDFEYSPATVRSSNLRSNARSGSKKPKILKRQPSLATENAELEIPETHKDAMDIDEPAEAESDDEIEATMPPPPKDPLPKRSRTQSTQRQPSVQRRGGSASDTERSSDPALRRRLGDMTAKFENLDVKYRNLREIGIKEAEKNFEKLQKQSEAKTKAANDLIASLKADLAIQTNLANEADSLQSRIADQETQIHSLLSQISTLTSTLASSQNDNKSLQAKLAASRSATIDNSTTSRVPGSAVKPNRSVMYSNPETAQIAQLKEDLYSDLTGLIFRNVKRGDEWDIYDCLQTGRNGTLHFKLSVASAVRTGTSYEDTEFQYTPLLDAERDRDLLALLPEYLTEEITFSRNSASQFYSRVMHTLTKQPPKPKVDDETD
ncbi:MAG: hypothetical protein M1834_003907 [Cirrosporium novae-zelandiae]|nr:MAG: hypothetical protein M1834_003907 [Cirrosporium novae-zelandiae]